jgi:hypothetical protein
MEAFLIEAETIPGSTQTKPQFTPDDDGSTLLPQVKGTQRGVFEMAAVMPLKRTFRGADRARITKLLKSLRSIASMDIRNAAKASAAGTTATYFYMAGSADLSNAINDVTDRCIAALLQRG